MNARKGITMNNAIIPTKLTDGVRTRAVWGQTGFWAVVAGITLAVLGWITWETRQEIALEIASPAIALSFADTSPTTINVFAMEPEFHLRFMEEKRNATSGDLPSQF